MRSDLIPSEYCEELTCLRSHVTPFSFAEVKKVIAQEYGVKSWREMFSSLEAQPLGSASIAQVHKAVLKDGRAVVVKVQRPGIKETMGQDMAILRRAIDYISCPKVEKHLTTSKILVMEYVEGGSIDNCEMLSALGYERDEIAQKLAVNYAKQVLDDGLFHADPHPGNIVIREGKIIWLDLGMVGRITSGIRNSLPQHSRQ